MGILEGFYAALKRELRRGKQIKGAILTIAITPLATLLVLSAIFYNGVPTKLPIAVLDGDNTPLSRKVVQMIGSTSGVEVAYTIPSLEEGEKLIKRGEVLGIFALPKDFEKDIYRNKATDAALFVSGTNILSASLIQKAVATTIQTYSVGVTVNKLVSSGMTEKGAYVKAMPILFDSHILFNPYTSYAYYLLPAFMPLILLTFVILSTIYAIGKELKEGTAKQWLDSSGGNIYAALAGKLLPYGALLFMVAVIIFFVLFQFFGLPCNGSLAMILLSSALLIIAYQSMGILFIALCANLRLALSLGAGYSVLAFSFSGVTFPSLAMGYWALMGYIFPFYYYMDIVIAQSLRGAPLLYSLWPLYMMALFSLLALIIMPRLRSVITNNKFWYKN